MPSLAIGLVAYGLSDESALIRGPAIGRQLFATAMQAVGVLVGTRMGRPIARGVARAVIPPKPRQLLAFLWQADGKPVPPP